MSDQKRDVYLLDRGGLATARLVFQHYAVVKSQGWLLHPDVHASISSLETPRIADLATGNGIWAFEVAEEFPNAEVLGTDISPEQFPHPVTWPKNVKLELGDIFGKISEEDQQQFDVVHIRLMIAAIYTMDKDVLMRNVLSLLKPGGYIQWDEAVEPLAITVDRNLNANYEIASYVERMFTISNFRPACQWAATLPAVYAQYGLEDIVGHKPELRASTLPQQTQSLAWSCREVLEFAVKMGRPGAEKVLELATQDMNDLHAAGYMSAYSWLVAVGKKPS